MAGGQPNPRLLRAPQHPPALIPSLGGFLSAPPGFSPGPAGGSGAAWLPPSHKQRSPRAPQPSAGRSSRPGIPGVGGGQPESSARSAAGPVSPQPAGLGGAGMGSRRRTTAQSSSSRRRPARRSRHRSASLTRHGRQRRLASSPMPPPPSSGLPERGRRGDWPPPPDWLAGPPIGVGSAPRGGGGAPPWSGSRVAANRRRCPASSALTHQRAGRGKGGGKEGEAARGGLWSPNWQGKRAIKFCLFFPAPRLGEGGRGLYKSSRLRFVIGRWCHPSDERGGGL